MLRLSTVRRVGHTSPTPAKYSQLPGMWGVEAGPQQDSLSRRLFFYRKVFFRRIGQLTAPFKTPRVKYIYRRTRFHLFRTSILTMATVGIALFLHVIISMMYHQYTVGTTSRNLERKIREHRVSKQVLQMVREREREIVHELDVKGAEKNIAAQAKAK